MVDYNPKDWFSLIFKFHKSDTFRKLFPLMLCVAIYCTIVVYIEDTHYPIKSSNTAHSLLGFVISLLLVFRTNTAYDRWWEGRRQFGALTNNSRSLAIKLSVFLKNHADLKQQAIILLGNYGLCITEHLSNQHKYEVLQDCKEYPLTDVMSSNHKPNAVAFQIMTFVKSLVDKNIINSNELLYINNELNMYTDVVGACERIKNTPIPYSYSLFIKKFIFVYIMTIPIFLGHDFGYAIVPLTTFIFYVLVSIEMIAEEIEDPFNGDSNDLPTSEISQNIRANIKEIFEK